MGYEPGLVLSRILLKLTLRVHYELSHFCPSPQYDFFFRLNQYKLTQGVKTYKKKEKFFLALPKFAISNFRQWTEKKKFLKPINSEI